MQISNNKIRKDKVTIDKVNNYCVHLLSHFFVTFTDFARYLEGLNQFSPFLELSEVSVNPLFVDFQEKDEGIKADIH